MLCGQHATIAVISNQMHPVKQPVNAFMNSTCVVLCVKNCMVKLCVGRHLLDNCIASSGQLSIPAAITWPNTCINKHIGQGVLLHCTYTECSLYVCALST